MTVIVLFISNAHTCTPGEAWPWAGFLLLLVNVPPIGLLLTHLSLSESKNCWHRLSPLLQTQFTFDSPAGSFPALCRQAGLAERETSVIFFSGCLSAVFKQWKWSWQCYSKGSLFPSPLSFETQPPVRVDVYLCFSLVSVRPKEVIKPNLRCSCAETVQSIGQKSIRNEETNV